MNKPNLIMTCWQCNKLLRITRKKLAQVGNYPQCTQHEAEFRAYLTNLHYTQG
jgi:hypothetical protein